MWASTRTNTAICRTAPLIAPMSRLLWSKFTNSWCKISYPSRHIGRGSIYIRSIFSIELWYPIGTLCWSKCRKVQHAKAWSFWRFWVCILAETSINLKLQLQVELSYMKFQVQPSSKLSKIFSSIDIIWYNNNMQLLLSKWQRTVRKFCNITISQIFQILLTRKLQSYPLYV